MSEYSREEMRGMVLDHMHAMVRYWNATDRPREEVLDGLAFSFLVMLDGHTASLPGFALIPLPHEGDEAADKEMDGAWWPCPRGNDRELIESRDIIGADLLHEAWYPKVTT